MNRITKQLVGWLAVLALGIWAVVPALASAKTEDVTVTLPEFAVRLNGREVDNQYSQYPLLVYHNVTYFPMTYYGSRYLGVETSWSRENGVGVYQNGVRWNWHDYPRYLPNRKTMEASIQRGHVRVNNQLIDNSQETYPLLSFRDVTYFPLTWRFAVDEFGWTYQYSPRDGLSIDSPGAITAREITLPIKEYDDGAGAFVKAGDYYYYENEQGAICQAAVAQPEQVRVIYPLPQEKSGIKDKDHSSGPLLQLEHDVVLLRYWQKTDNGEQACYVQLLPDGTARELYQGSGYLQCYADAVFLNTCDIAAQTGALLVRKTGETRFSPLTTQDFYCSDVQLWRTGNEMLFLGGQGQTNGQTPERKILAIDQKTGSLRQLTRENVSSFAVDGDIVYYRDDSDLLYRIPLQGGTAEQVSSVPVARFVVHNGVICYADSQTGELYVLGGSEALNPGGIVSGMEVQEDFFVVHFAEESTSAYKTMILSRKGKVLFKTTERTASMIIEDGKVSFVKLRGT